MAILVDADTKVICQGITGSFGAVHTKGCHRYGTKMVGRRDPRQGRAEGRQRAADLRHRRAGGPRPGRDATMIFVPPPFAADAILEAATPA
jgi:succinyl-CoA synthetase alpha subunit